MKRFIALLGIIYLCAEFGFNAHLLDVISGIHTNSDIQKIEWFGKFISSVGFWIVLLKLLSMAGKKWSWATNTALSVFLAILAGFIMVNLQDQIANNLANDATGQERKAAILIQATMADVIQGNSSIHGFNFSKQDLRTPEGKTFVALLPAFSINNPNVVAIYAIPAAQALKNRALSAENEAFELYWDQYKALSNYVRNIYNNQYQCHSNKLETPTGEVAWLSYLNEVGDRINIHQVPSLDMQAKIIQKVRESGVNVPNDWLPDDKEGFIAAYNALGNEAKAREAFMKASNGLPPDLSWAEFSKHIVVQNEIKKNFKNIVKKDNLSLDLNQSQFMNQFIRTSSKIDLNKSMAIINSNSEDFEDNNHLSGIGREAIKSVKIPIISLAFSCVFAILNLLLLVISLFTSLKAKGLVALASIIIIFTPFLLANKISSSNTFADVLIAMPKAVAIPTLWLTNAQPFAYPIGHFFTDKLNLQSGIKTIKTTDHITSFNFVNIPACNTI